MRGRKPKPDSLRVCGAPHSLADRPGGVVPDKPDWLDKDASAEWDRIVPELAAGGYVGEADATMLAGYCVQFSIWRQAQRQIADQGMLEQGISGAKANPAIKIMQDAAREMRMIAAEFGFTPASRSRIRVSGTGGGEEGDDFEGWQYGEGPRLADANEVG